MSFPAYFIRKSLYLEYMAIVSKERFVRVLLLNRIHGASITTHNCLDDDWDDKFEPCTENEFASALIIARELIEKGLPKEVKNIVHETVY